MMNNIYEEIRLRALKVIDTDLLDKNITVKARVLSTEEVIGNPELDDFPLIKGRERLMQAEIDGSYGWRLQISMGISKGHSKIY